MTKYRTVCWYCGTALKSNGQAEMDAHTKDQGINHSRFMTEVDTSTTPGVGNEVLMSLEKGLTSTNEELASGKNK